MQVIARRDALRKLLKLFAFEERPQFRLADQDDLQEFLPRCFKVGQKADLFEHIVTEILSLIDDEYSPSILGMGLQQMPIKASMKVLMLAGSLGRGMPSSSNTVASSSGTVRRGFMIKAISVSAGAAGPCIGTE